jgi:hypothetical protein
MNDTNYHIVVAYESIGLDIEETLEERLFYIIDALSSMALLDGSRGEIAQ